MAKKNDRFDVISSDLRAEPMRAQHAEPEARHEGRQHEQDVAEGPRPRHLQGIVAAFA
jgi:hypothetical protein